MNTDFLGNGWKFNLNSTGIPALGMIGVDVDADHVIAEASDDESIQESIWLILSTAPGERVGRPDFGCGIHNLVFATQTPGTFGDMINAVEQALSSWEPRITVLSVDCYQDPTPGDPPSAVIIEVNYQVAATNSRKNLVYPFYLSA